MLDSTDPIRSLYLFSQGCGVANGSFDPFLSVDELKYVTKSCDNPLCVNTPTCQHPELHTFLHEVDGLDFDIQLSNVPYTLPGYIPTLDYRSRNLQNLSTKHYPVVAITLDDILKSGIKMVAGALHEQEIRFRLTTLLGPAFKGKKTILFLTGPDTLIEWAWYMRNEVRLFQTIASMGFDAVVGFNFSVIDGECPVAHALAQKKSMFSNKLAEQFGLRSIPHIYAVNEYHVERYANWLNANPHITLCAINCQLQDKPEDIDTLVKTTTMLLRRVPHLRLLLQGFRITHLYRFGTYIDRIHIVEKSPIKDGQFGRKIQVVPETVELKRAWRRRDEDNMSIVIQNINHRKVYYELIKQKHATNYRFPNALLNELLDSKTLGLNTVLK